MIKLTHNTIDLGKLIEWLQTEPQLTQGEKVKEFEKRWSDYIGCKYSVYVNSGSSANLLMLYALIHNKLLKNKKIVVPALSWATTVSPVIQFGLQPILCDCNMENLGCDLTHLEKIFKEHNPSCLILVQALGFMNDMDIVKSLCEKYKVILLEDSCETVGSKYKGKMSGTFGLMSSFSFYFSHHITTIEGGMVCTDDENLYELLVMLRAHGWVRDVKKKFTNYKVCEFKKLYTFYIPGFNFRNTDLHAFIGLKQLESIETMTHQRLENYVLYNKLFKDMNILKLPAPDPENVISNFAYPLVFFKEREKKTVIKKLKDEAEIRPIISGNMATQPFIMESNSIVKDIVNAEVIDKNGIYLPNHIGIGMKDIFLLERLIKGD